MSRRHWTDREVELVRTMYPHTPTAEIAKSIDRSITMVYQVAQRLGLKKTPEYLAGPHACRLRRGDNVGKLSRFGKGHVPVNKGLRRPGWSAGRMKETQFKKGHRGGRAVEVYKPIGSERISKDGYLERKVNEDMPFQKRWRAVHLLIWEDANGPLPKGFAVSFKNRDKNDRRLENLELISRAELCRRNTIHNLPPELKGAIRTLGTIKRRIKRREREEQNRRSA